MKKLIVLFCLMVASAVKAQAPQYLNYQGIARNSSGVIVTTPIGIKFEILQGSAIGTVVYDETNTITPSSAGVFTAAIGNGVPGIGTFPSINWANGPYYIRVNIDPAGGTSYSTVGTSQLLSVPYALYAEKAGNTQTVNIAGPSVTGTYPNYTIMPGAGLTTSTGISISGGTITNTAPNQTVNITGSAVTGSYPSYTITTPASPTASTGISIVGGTVTNTAPDQTVTLAAAGISSVTGTYPSYTVDVPAPSLNYNTGTNVLTLTQGTAVATTTLVGAGSNTVAMFAQGIATVSPVGAGSSFTLGVPSPSFTSAGPTTISGTYPNYTVNSPAASATNLQINSPHTTSTLSANNFSITVAPTNITGSGVSGAYPNYTITSAAQTSVTSGSANVTVTGIAPAYTISAATPTLQTNAPNTVTSLGLNSYSINVPQVNLTGVGVASVSGTYPNYNISVPQPTITSLGNTITIAQGTSVATATLANGPWTYTSSTLYSTANSTNDKVTIGKNIGSSMLEVELTAAGTNTSNPVVSVVNSNSSFLGNPVLRVRNVNGSATGLIVDQSNLGDGIAINSTNATNGSNALQVQQNGTGNAGYFNINNSTTTSRVIEASTNGLGNVFAATITNSLSTSSLFNGTTNGTSGIFITNTHSTGIGGSFNTIGTAVYASNTGFFHTIQSQNTHTSTSAYAGNFAGGVFVSGKNNLSSGHAFKVQDNVFNELFNVRNDGNVGIGTGSPGAKLDISPNATYTGNVVAITNPNSANTNAALYLSSAGSGGGMQVINSNASSNAGNFYNTNASSTSAALVVQNNGPGNSVDIYNVGGGRSLSASNTATLPTAFFNNSGNGYALYAQNSSAVISRAGFIIGGLDIMGKTTTSSTFPLVITNSGSTNLFNVRDDGNVGINVTNPGYRLAVLSTNSTSAIFASNTSAAAIINVNGVTGLTSSTHSLSAGVVGQTTGANSAGVLGESQSNGPSVFGYKGTVGGNAGRFESASLANTADAIFASNSGTAAVIHTKNNTNASSGHLGLLIEDGHIGAEITTALPTASVNNGACTACTAGSGTVMPHSTDIAGTITFGMTASYAATFDFTVNYAKPYRKIPVVNITPANLVGGNVNKIYVQNLGAPGNYTGFRVFFLGGISGGAGSPQFNYIVIEGAN